MLSRIEVQAPVMASGDVVKSDGHLGRVLDLAQLTDAELADTVPEVHMALAVRRAGRLGVTCWPGSDAWLEKSKHHVATTATEHNTFVVDRLYALDTLADPNAPMRWIDSDEGQLSVFGFAAQNWRGGDHIVASGRPDLPPIKITEKQRRWAWARLWQDLSLLAFRNDDVSPTSTQAALPRGAQTAHVLVDERIAAGAVIPDATDKMCSVPDAYGISMSEDSAWAYSVAVALEVRRAGEHFSLDPPGASGRPNGPEMLWRSIRDDSREAALKLVGGLLLLTGAAVAADFVYTAVASAPEVPQ